MTRSLAKSRKQELPKVEPVAKPERFRPWLLAALAMLLVARPMVPSEGVAWLGDGQPLVVGWIVLAASYLAWATLKGRLARPFDLVDGAVVALVTLCVLSCLLAFNEATIRYSMNMLGEWVALGLVFLL